MVLIPCLVDVFLPRSLCHLRLTTMPVSSLTIRKTVLILISMDTNILSEIHSTKLE